MKHRFLVILFSFTLMSCQYFDTDKISSETFYEEDLKTINWDDVDQYPKFDVCSGYIEKLDQKTCFEQTLSNQLYSSINSRKIILSGDIDETVLVYLSISEEGKITHLDINMDSLMVQTIPQLETWLLQSIDSLPVVEPAYKRDIPVETQFTLPIVIKTATD